MNDNRAIPVIEMRAVTVGAMADPGFAVLEGVDWLVAPGEFWVVAGQQHSGKSEFLMMTGGLMPPAGGDYRFFGNPTGIFDESRLADRLRIGFIFETAQLFHYLTIAENVTLPLRYHRNLAEAEAAGAVADLLELTGLKPIADAAPANLARSWLKRAGLARALTMRPEVLLLDNPLAGLDAPMTLVATTDDLRPWRHGGRKFALLKDKQFVRLGSWAEMTASGEPLVKEMLAAPAAATEERGRPAD